MRRIDSRGGVQRAAALLLALFALAACNDLPRDPQGTSARVAGGRLRVGLVEHPPWVVRTAGEPGGAEVALVRELAREVGATPEWHWGGEEQHMTALERYELDLVIGGITTKTAWSQKIALTRPYYEDEQRKKKHVVAAPPGENAWLKRLQEFLDAHRDEAARLAQREVR